VREQVVGLKDEAELAPNRHSADRRIGDHLAVEEDVAVVDVDEQVDAAQQGGLARAGGADQRDRLVLGDLQVDALQHLAIAEGLGDAFDCDHRGAAHRTRPRSQRSSIRASGIVTARYRSAAQSSGV
jgi:hypothetical protein